MAVLNRTLDVSEQRKVFELTVNTFATGTSLYAVPTGATYLIGVVPWASTLDVAQLAAYGLSGAPTYQINVDRFITGTGFTTIILATGTSNLAVAFGTSGIGTVGSSLVGVSGMILAGFGSSIAGQSGSTLLNLLANDVLLLRTGGTTAAANSVAVTVVLKPLQDAKTNFGLNI